MTLTMQSRLSVLILVALCALPLTLSFRTGDIVRSLMEGAADNLSASGGDEAVTTCPEGIDDDKTLASNDMAKGYGLESCSQTYDLLTQYMGNADMLCKSIGKGVCNCTCAGVEFEPSKAIEVFSLADAPAVGGFYGDALFDCSDVKANAGGKNAKVLPPRAQDWRCHELGEVGVLLWNVEEDGETISFAVEFASAGGGAAIGISSNGGMYGADLLWVGKDDAGVWSVKDMFSRGYAEDGSLVSLDDSQDTELEWSEEVDGRIAFIVSRPIQPCDQYDDLEIIDGVMHLIWARFSDHGHSYHGPGKNDRGTIYINLLKEDEALSHVIPEDPSDLFAVDLRMVENGDRYSLPDDQVNTYACRSFELPSDQPYHVVSYEPILDTVKTDANVVHHIVVYSCDEDPASPTPQECGSMAAMCTMIEMAWAVGMPRQVLPPAAGIQLKKYVLMEMHYENLGRENGVLDGSGLRLTFTPKLREQHFGYLIVGTDLSRTESLEPDQGNVVRQGFCAAECLADHLPEGGVQVHGQFFHSHLQGRSLWTQHYRGDEEMQTLGDMPYYDFNHQFFKYTSDEPRLMPGDALVTTCVYDTVGKADPTDFGLETRQEMCFNVVGMYPKIDMQFCWNQTEDGGRCEWGSDTVAKGGVPFASIPYAEPIPESCSVMDLEDTPAGTDSDVGEDPNTNSLSGAGYLFVSSTVFFVTLMQTSCLLW